MEPLLNKLIEVQLGPFALMYDELKSNRKVRKIAFILLIVYYSLGLTALVYGSITEELDSDFIIDLLLAPFVILFLMLLAVLLRNSSVRDEVELQNIMLEGKEIRTKIEQKKELEIFDTIQLSLNQLNEYYTINKTQAKSSFRFSLFAIIIGLITIISGIWLYYYGKNPNINTSILTSIAGLLLEFIGGAYFFVYKKSIEQVNFFYGQLIKVQDTMLAINLARGITIKEKEVDMTEKIIISLLERSLK